MQTVTKRINILTFTVAILTDVHSN